MMKKILLSAITATVLVMSNASYASWFGNNNDTPWGGNGWGNDWNPYDEWDPRYWIREMDNEFADDDYYGPGPYGYGGPNGYGGPGPYGPPPGYYGGPGPYGPPPGYAPPQFNGPNGGPRPYGPPPGYRGPAPQQAPQGRQ